MAAYTNLKQGSVGTQVQVADTQHTTGGVGGSAEVSLRETETLRLEVPVPVPVSESIREQLLIEEYIALRSEIEKRVEVRQQILALTLLVAGTFLTVGVQPNVPEVVLLFYPVIAMFLGAIWEHNDLRVGQINFYIRTEVEKLFGDTVPGWETFRLRTFRAHREKRHKQASDSTTAPLHPLTSQFGLVAFATRGTFLATQAMAIVVAALRYAYDLWQAVGRQGIAPTEPGQLGLSIVMVLLLLVDCGILVATRYLVQHKR
jgi:hypothetical protein